MPRQRKPRIGGVPGKHASPGSGSVYQDARGRWRGAAMVTAPDGTRRRVYVTGADEADARAELDRQRRLIDTGSAHSLTPQTTLRDYVARWLDTVIKPTQRTTTLYAQTYQLSQVCAVLGDVQLGKLAVADVQRAVAALERTRNARTVRTYVDTLKRALDQAVAWHLIKANPVHGAVLPRVERRPYQTLTPEQLGTLLRTAAEEDDPLHAYWTLLATTGLRRSEGMGLRWQDVDLDRALLTVSGQLVRDHAGGMERTEPKTSAARRTVALMGMAVAALRDHRERQPGSGDELVFRRANGEPWGDTEINRRFRALLAAAELPAVRLHDLRHTVATLLMERGTPAPVVSALMGHANTAITLSIYSHATQPMHAAAMRDLEGVFAARFGVVADAVAAPLSRTEPYTGVDAPPWQREAQ